MRPAVPTGTVNRYCAVRDMFPDPDLETGVNVGHPPGTLPVSTIPPMKPPGAVRFTVRSTVPEAPSETEQRTVSEGVGGGLGTLLHVAPAT